MAVPIESPNLPGGPPPDSDQLESLERIEQLENILRSLIGSLNKYSYVPNEYAETMLGTLDDIPDGTSFQRVKAAEVDVNGSITITAPGNVTNVEANADVTDKTNVGTAITNTVTITGGGITMSAGGKIMGGKASYPDAATAGYYLGYSGGKYVFRVGNATEYWDFDGTNSKLMSSNVIIGDADNGAGYNFGVVGLVSGATSGIFCYSDTNSNESSLQLLKSHQDTVGETQTVNGEYLGNIHWSATQGAAGVYKEAAQIYVRQDGTNNSTFCPSKLVIRVDSTNAQREFIFDNAGTFTSAGAIVAAGTLTGVTNITMTGALATATTIASSGTITCGDELRIGGDTSGLASHVTFTNNVADTPTNDPGWTSSSSVDMNAPDIYLKIYSGTTAYVIPAFRT